MIRKYLRFYGFVQGVGFRYRAKYAAEFAEIQGTEEQIDRVILEIEQGRYVKIENMEVRTIPIKEGGKKLSNTLRLYFLRKDRIS